MSTVRLKSPVQIALFLVRCRTIVDPKKRTVCMASSCKSMHDKDLSRILRIGQGMLYFKRAVSHAVGKGAAPEGALHWRCSCAGILTATRRIRPVYNPLLYCPRVLVGGTIISPA